MDFANAAAGALDAARNWFAGTEGDSSPLVGLALARGPGAVVDRAAASVVEGASTIGATILDAGTQAAVEAGLDAMLPVAGGQTLVNGAKTAGLVVAGTTLTLSSLALTAVVAVVSGMRSCGSDDGPGVDAPTSPSVMVPDDLQPVASGDAEFDRALRELTRGRMLPGRAIVGDGPPTPRELDDLLREFARRYGAIPVRPGPPESDATSAAAQADSPGAGTPTGPMPAAVDERAPQDNRTNRAQGRRRAVADNAVDAGSVQAAHHMHDAFDLAGGHLHAFYAALIATRPEVSNDALAVLAGQAFRSADGFIDSAAAALAKAPDEEALLALRTFVGRASLVLATFHDVVSDFAGELSRQRQTGDTTVPGSADPGSGATTLASTVRELDDRASSLQRRVGNLAARVVSRERALSGKVDFHALVESLEPAGAFDDLPLAVDPSQRFPGLQPIRMMGDLLAPSLSTYLDANGIDDFPRRLVDANNHSSRAALSVFMADRTIGPWMHEYFSGRFLDSPGFRRDVDAAMQGLEDFARDAFTTAGARARADGIADFDLDPKRRPVNDRKLFTALELRYAVDLARAQVAVPLTLVAFPPAYVQYAMNLNAAVDGAVRLDPRHTLRAREVASLLEGAWDGSNFIDEVIPATGLFQHRRADGDPSTPVVPSDLQSGFSGTMRWGAFRHTVVLGERKKEPLVLTCPALRTIREGVEARDPASGGGALGHLYTRVVDLVQRDPQARRIGDEIERRLELGTRRAAPDAAPEDSE